MRVAHNSIFILYVLSTMAVGQSASTFPESPKCKSATDVITNADVQDWLDFMAQQLPTVTELRTKMGNTANNKLALIKAQRVRNLFITGAYVRLCLEKVLNNGACQGSPDPTFFWSCAAAFGSNTAGQYIAEGIGNYEIGYSSGAHWVDRIIGNKGILPALGVLGGANSQICDNIVWQQFAAAKCGNLYAVRLLERSTLPNKEQLKLFWKKAESEKMKFENRAESDRAVFTGDIRGTATEDLLYLEQKLIQPNMENHRNLLGRLSKADAIQSGVISAQSFKRFSVETRNLNPNTVNLSNFSQRFIWERDQLMPKILGNILRDGCKEGSQFNILARSIAERQITAARDIPGISQYPRIKFPAKSTGVNAPALTDSLHYR